MYVIITQEDSLIFTYSLDGFLTENGDPKEGLIIIETEANFEVKLIIENNHIVNIDTGEDNEN